MMKNILRKREEGFTLVELMIVVAIIGVLAALAIYGVSRYLKHSKTAEATRNLSAIETGAKNSFQLDTDTSSTGAGPFVHQFCGAATSVPASAPAASKYVSTAADWSGSNTAGWQCLKFSMTSPQFYSYSYTAGGTATGATYTATANGDLDGNGTLSTFQLVGTGDTNGDARRSSFSVTNEDE